MKIKQGLQNIYYLIVAFALTNSAFIIYLSNITDNEFSAALNRFTLYAIVIISLGMIIATKNAVAKILPTVFFFVFLVLFQSFFFDQPKESNYINDFIIHGFGGLFVGFAITDYKKLISFVGGLSFLFGLMFITEPINRSLLKVNEMSTGYALIPLVIFMLLLFFTSERNIRFVLLFVAIPLGITTFLFTSRGCGLSIMLATMMFYITKAQSQGKKINTRIILLVLVIVLLFLMLTMLISNGLISIGNAKEGSLIYKIFKETVADSNGRAEIWEMGFDILKSHPFIGVGFGGDHIIASSYFTRYSSIHSVLLELLINFGIPLGIIIIYLYFKRYITCVKSQINGTAVMLVWAIACSFLLKLFFSSTYLSNMFPVMLVYGVCTNLYYSKRNLGFVFRFRE